MPDRGRCSVSLGENPPCRHSAVSPGFLPEMGGTGLCVSEGCRCPSDCLQGHGDSPPAPTQQWVPAQHLTLRATEGAVGISHLMVGGRQVNPQSLVELGSCLCNPTCPTSKSTRWPLNAGMSTTD